MGIQTKCKSCKTVSPIRTDICDKCGGTSFVPFEDGETKTIAEIVDAQENKKIEDNKIEKEKINEIKKDINKEETEKKSDKKKDKKDDKKNDKENESKS